MPFVVFRRDLREYGTSSEVGAVSFDAEGFSRVGRDQDRGRRHIPLELIKGGLFGGLPMPLGVVPGEVEEGSGVLGEVFNKLPIEVGEAQEGLHLLLIRRGGPFRNSSHFDRVHRDGVVGYDYPEVLNRRPFELAFVWPKV